MKVEGAPTIPKSEQSLEDSWENANEEFREDISADPLSNLPEKDSTQVSSESEENYQERVKAVKLGENYELDLGDEPSTGKESEESSVSRREMLGLEQRTSQTRSTIPSAKNKNALDQIGSFGKRALNNMYERVFIGAKGSERELRNRKKEIAGNQEVIDRFSAESDTLNAQLEFNDETFSQLEQQETEIRTDIEAARAEGVSNVSSLERVLEGIARQKDDLRTKREKMTIQIERNNRHINDFTEKRDAVADRMATFYAEQAAPLKENLERYQNAESLLEFQAMAQEIEHESAMKTLQEIEAKREKRLAIAERAQLSRKDTADMILLLDQKITSIRDRISSEQSLMKANQREVAEAVENFKQQLRPHESNMREFQRVTNRSEIRIEPLQEPVTSTEAEDVEQEFENFAAEESINDSTEHEVSTFIDMWNKHIQDKFPNDAKGLQVNKAQFLKRSGWRPSFAINYDKFEKIIEGYYKFNKVNFANRSETADEFRAQLAE